MKCTAHIYRGAWGRGRRWAADLYWDDGKIFKCWVTGYKSKKGIIAHINSVGPKIVRSITY